MKKSANASFSLLLDTASPIITDTLIKPENDIGKYHSKIALHEFQYCSYPTQCLPLMFG